MLKQAISKGSVDRIAIGFSGLCLVHCIGSIAFVGLLASVGHMLENPLFHEVGLMIAIVLGALGLGHGALSHGVMMPASIGALGLGMMAGSLTLPHGMAEMAWSITGVLVLALGHELNRRAGTRRH